MAGEESGTEYNSGDFPNCEKEPWRKDANGDIHYLLTKRERAMITQVRATFVSGLLKPDERLALPNDTRVLLTIEPIIERPESAAAWQALKNRLRQRPVHAAGKHFSRDELHERR
jgi:hypothetical protein